MGSLVDLPSVPLTALAGQSDGLVVEVLPGGTGLRLAGEADVSSLGRLTEVLGTLPAGVGTVHIDLAALAFADVASARELVALTRQARPPRVILRHPPSALRRLIGLLWPDSDAIFG